MPNIVFDSSDGVDAFEELSRDFLKKIFDLDLDDVMITDGSCIGDFRSLDKSNADFLADVYNRIQQTYHVNVRGTTRLLEIFRLLDINRTIQ